MLSLNFILKDMEIPNKNLSKLELSNKNNVKEFSQILEDKKSSIQRDVKTKSTDNSGINRELKVQEEKKENYLAKEEPEENIKSKEEIQYNLESLINYIYGLILNSDFEAEETQDLNLELIKLEMENFNTEIEHLLENNVSFDQKNIIEVMEKIDSLIPSFNEKLDKGINASDTIGLTLEEVLLELNKIKENMKLNTNKDSQLIEEDFNNFEVEEGLTPENYQNKGLEVEKTLDNKVVLKGDRINLDDIITNRMEEAKTDEIDSNNPMIKMVDRWRNDEKPEFVIKAYEEVDKKQLIEQIVNKAKLIIDDNKQEIKIRLKPEILGELMLKMEVEKGTVLAKIMVDNYRTKELIEANLYQLKEDMKENGLKIKTFQVFVGTNEDFQRENRQGFNFKKRPGKLKVKNEDLKEIKTYGVNNFINTREVYEDGSINLFA